jgi:hypothetical protein
MLLARYSRNSLARLMSCLDVSPGATSEMKEGMPVSMVLFLIRYSIIIITLSLLHCNYYYAPVITLQLLCCCSYNVTVTPAFVPLIAWVLCNQHLFNDVIGVYLGERAHSDIGLEEDITIISR